MWVNEAQNYAEKKSSMTIICICTLAPLPDCISAGIGRDYTHLLNAGVPPVGTLAYDTQSLRRN